MKDGFIKVAAATPEIQVADCDFNAGAIISEIIKADKLGVNFLVLPELCITGYTCGDLFYQNTLLEGALTALQRIMNATKQTDMIVIAGCPVKFRGKLYNCGIVLQKGEILGIVPKQYLPNYNEFYEMRQFTAWESDEIAEITLFGKDYLLGWSYVFVCEEMNEFAFQVELCEDLWAVTPPSINHALNGATIIANLSASNEMVGKDSYRHDLVVGQSARLICGYVYASAGDGESTTDMIFGGHSIIAENGAVLAESKLFENGITVSEIDVKKLDFERRKNTSFRVNNKAKTVYFSMNMKNTRLTRFVSKTPFIPYSKNDKDKRCETILAMQSQGLKKRIKHTHAQTAVVGISGGLDSCLALLVMVNAMDLLSRPHSDIVAVTMPCFGTTNRTKSNAEKLCEALGVTLRTVDITAAVKQHFTDIDHDINDHSVVFENGQARERTKILMNIANQQNGLVVGTGDLSELALGWATYNGDHMSMYGVNASVPKTLIRHIVKYYSDVSTDKLLQEVLLDILDTPVSPELLPADNDKMTQKTEDIVGPYELHDFFLYYGIRWGFSPKKVFRMAVYAFNGEYENQTILKWLKTFYRRFFSQQFKRSCLPDSPKVGSVTLSPRADWRMPSDACAALWQKEIDEIEID